MPKKVRSARGQLLDFDLMHIKEQIATATPPIDVKQREDFIDRKLRRRLKNAKRKIVDSAKIEVAPNVAEVSAEPPADAVKIEEVDQKPTKPKAKPKQKGRPRKTK